MRYSLAEKGITMAKVDEVKKALDVCIYNESNCVGCVYREYEGGLCIDALLKDAYNLLEQLAAERKDNENECNT